MYGGYGNFGYGGGYGGGGMMGGNETYIIVLCCCCFLCLALIAAGYFTNVLCGMGFGANCPKKETTPTPDPDDTVAPAPPTPAINTCNESYGTTPRTDANDPRPPIRPEYCVNEPRTVGRDCYYWKVQKDATGRDRWIRVPDSSKADMYFGGSCVPQVKCKDVIDPASLPRYSELEPAELLNQCQGVSPTATNEADTVKILTQHAQEVGAAWTDTSAWTDTHSKVWYNNVLKYVGQKDLNAYITNAVKATRTLKNKFSTTTLKKSTFAYILEAAVRTPENRADWIVDIVNSFVRRPLTPAQMNEAYFVTTHMRGILPNMIRWETLIENPLYFGVK